MQGKVTPNRSAKTKVYAGIDVCKDWLDVHIASTGEELRVENKPKGLRKLARWLAAAGVERVVMEPTGKYHRSASRHLHDNGFGVCIVDPMRARLFAQSTGKLAKTDRLDARMLALMGTIYDVDATPPTSVLLEQMQEILRARQSAVDDRTALSNQLGESKTKVVCQQLKRRMHRLDDDKAKLEAELDRLIASDPVIARRFAIARSITGVGPVAAAWLAIGVPELGSCANKEAAMLVGLAPVACDSGDQRGKRKIRGGRADVRRGIYMAATSAANHNPTLKPFYDRLIAAGKAYKVAITAVMRKLVTLANTLIKEDRLWQPTAPKIA
jgi:transposase